MLSRIYKLWAYSAGHAQLVIRGLPTAEDDGNLDHIFVGVGYVDAPQTIEGLSVRAANDIESRERSESAHAGQTWFVLEGEVGPSRRAMGYVLARSHRVDANELSRLTTAIDELLPEASRALELERQLLVALAAAGLKVSLPHDNRSFDMFVAGAGEHQVAVEVKWYAGRPPPRAVRSLVMQLAPSVESSTVGIAVITGGIRDAIDRGRFADELGRHLTTALPSEVDHAVLSVEDDSLSAMALEIRRLGGL